MASFKGLVGRARGDQVAALTAEVAALREVVLNINHVVTQLDDTVNELNHDVRSGAERSPAAVPRLRRAAPARRRHGDRCDAGDRTPAGDPGRTARRRRDRTLERLDRRGGPSAHCSSTLVRSIIRRPASGGSGGTSPACSAVSSRSGRRCIALYGSDVEADVLAEAIPDLHAASGGARRSVRDHATPGTWYVATQLMLHPIPLDPIPRVDHRGPAARSRRVMYDVIPYRFPEQYQVEAERPTTSAAARAARPHRRRAARDLTVRRRDRGRGARRTRSIASR